MGYATPIVGHVTTVTRGVSVSNAAPGAQGLPNVDPVYTWVRLAQRVPVRIAILARANRTSARSECHHFGTRRQNSSLQSRVGVGTAMENIESTDRPAADR
jgi:multidrug resistance efflux pump